MSHPCPTQGSARCGSGCLTPRSTRSTGSSWTQRGPSLHSARTLPTPLGSTLPASSSAPVTERISTSARESSATSGCASSPPWAAPPAAQEDPAEPSQSTCASLSAAWPSSRDTPTPRSSPACRWRGSPPTRASSPDTEAAPTKMAALLGISRRGRPCSSWAVPLPWGPSPSSSARPPTRGWSPRRPPRPRESWAANPLRPSSTGCDLWGRTRWWTTPPKAGRASSARTSSTWCWTASARTRSSAGRRES
mmetsp:Transcript_8380/g.25122  ORF Transcript_8380/g.25122 Transcript_8380/m.25122 type:complete len:250 (-) Transcript_8380:4145-4894(-)